MNIARFDRPTCSMINADIEQALQAVAKKYGIEINRGTGRFDAGELTVKLSCKVRSAVSGTPVNFERNALMLGLPRDLYGKRVIIGNDDFEIVDLIPRRHKFPVSARRVGDGKLFKLSITSCKGAR